MVWKTKSTPAKPPPKTCTTCRPRKTSLVPTVCHSLDQALEALDADRAFLTKGGVFSNDMLDAYIALKMDEVTRFRQAVHPIEYDMYYSL